MKRIFLFSLFSVLLAFVLPLLLTVPNGRGREELPPTAVSPELSVVPTEPTVTPAPLPVLDSAVPLWLQTEEGVVEMSMAEYLPLALAAEMPAAFQMEALKAQAVALRSYALYYQGERKAAHPEADVCEKAACCAARMTKATLRENWGENFETYYAKICAAVTETDGQYLVWEETPALTVFHASSFGKTEAGTALGVNRAYLLSVPTPETEEAVRNLGSTVELTTEEFRRGVLSLAPEAELSGPAEQWLGQRNADASGRVESLEIGGQQLSGLALRQLFGLRSTNFTLEQTESGFVFHVLGNGHGLGMSQYGAELMAGDNHDYADILAHYYPGTRLVMALRSGD